MSHVPPGLRAVSCSIGGPPKVPSTLDRHTRPVSLVLVTHSQAHTLGHTLEAASSLSSALLLKISITFLLTPHDLNAAYLAPFLLLLPPPSHPFFRRKHHLFSRRPPSTLRPWTLFAALTGSISTALRHLPTLRKPPFPARSENLATLSNSASAATLINPMSLCSCGGLFSARICEGCTA